MTTRLRQGRELAPCGGPALNPPVWEQGEISGPTSENLTVREIVAQRGLMAPVSKRDEGQREESELAPGLQ